MPDADLPLVNAITSSVVPFRAQPTAALLDVIAGRYGIAPVDVVDAGGTNLNLHLRERGVVARVYAPWVTEARTRFVQRLRADLRAGGLPFTETVPTVDGDTLVVHDGRVLEVDRFVAGARMDEKTPQLDTAMELLGRVHTALATMAVGDDAPGAEVADARYPNHMPAEDAVEWARHAERVAGHLDPPTCSGLVELAESLAPAEAGLLPHQRRQLVHGDYWDNNVLFDAASRTRVVAVLDLDFCGVRPRVDDVALTLYYTTSERARPSVGVEHLRRLRRVLDRYDAALDEPLQPEERAALPAAMARTALFITRNVVAVDREPDGEEQQRRMLASVAVDIPWAIALARDLPAAQEIFTAARRSARTPRR